MTRVKQLALDVDVEMTAGSPFSITFTPTNAVVFTSPTVAYKTRGGDVVTGTAVPAVTTDGDTVTLTWSTTCSAANNTTTAKQGKVYSFEVQVTVDGVGPVPLFGGESTIWPVGVATSGVASSTSVTGTVNVGGVAISGTVTIGAQGPAGAAGPAGDDGATGADGKTVRNGSGAPSSGLGVDGDFYIDTTADAIYGPKTAGAWGSATSLIGPTGATGPAWPVSEELTTVAATGATETITVADGTVVDLTLDANCAITFASPGSGAGYSFTLILRQDGTGSRTVTWPASCRWPGGTDPVLSTAASSVDILSFFTVDNGTTWFGFFNGKGMAA